MSDVLTSINLRSTPQNQAADPRQVRNNAGGYAFAITPESQLRRFLILGVAGGTFYVGEKALTAQNAQLVIDFATNRCQHLVNEIVEVSTAGRALKQDQALFALAAAASLGDLDGRREAFAALPLVARTGTHLFQFVKYSQQFRGWGPMLRRGVARWYADKSIEDVAYQVLKYRQRHGWNHHDLLRSAHWPKGVTLSDAHSRLFDWIAIEREGDNPNSPRYGQTADLTGLTLVEGYQRARTAKVADIPNLVQQYRLTWEMLPDEALGSPAVWEALLDNGIGQTALIRQLPRLSQLGLLSPMAERTQKVAEQITDRARLRKGRVHPFQLLLAHRAYALGRNREQTWPASTPIIDALDAGFYAAYEAVEPSGQRIMLALDVSSSMTYPIPDYTRPKINGQWQYLPLSAREASAALALVIAANEPRHQIVGFTAGDLTRARGLTGTSGGLCELTISPRQRLADAVRTVSGLPFGGTDCSLPMRYALTQGLEVDAFIILTDNETNQSTEHPFQSLRRYRERVNPAAKMIVLAMTSTGFTIADPADAGMLDIAGLDAAVPTTVTDFVRGF